jgi:hypothetical protein
LDSCQATIQIGTNIGQQTVLYLQKNSEISPLFKCDSSTRAFYGLKDGKITVNFSGWEQNRVVLEGAKPLR